ncbi:hypothetical protein TSOC_005064 [Tetrabaena socialis]|uniref:Guanylate cyclase domain-containing protein n=1 Tax=Tetrabaena socialis TaxID=47790 RepID=A0A2J8A737_9CHLO|nr:hypothetical protein TSOC_005064 [Tetrabaena socialis]|eukprot:PNH08339.1 hypothetical protein TSOC_005064 [Tetrabaena socialis]
MQLLHLVSFTKQPTAKVALEPALARAWAPRRGRRPPKAARQHDGSHHGGSGGGGEAEAGAGAEAGHCLATFSAGSSHSAATLQGTPQPSQTARSPAGGAAAGAPSPAPAAVSPRQQGPAGGAEAEALEAFWATTPELSQRLVLVPPPRLPPGSETVYGTDVYGAPVGRLTYVAVRVSAVAALLEWDERVAWEALRLLQRLAAAGLRRVGGGYMSSPQPGHLYAAFTCAAAAVRWAEGLRLELLAAPWSQELLSHELCEPVEVVEESGEDDEEVEETEEDGALPDDSPMRRRSSRMQSAPTSTRGRTRTASGLHRGATAHNLFSSLLHLHSHHNHQHNHQHNGHNGHTHTSHQLAAGSLLDMFHHYAVQSPQHPAVHHHQLPHGAAAGGLAAWISSRLDRHAVHAPPGGGGSPSPGTSTLGSPLNHRPHHANHHFFNRQPPIAGGSPPSTPFAPAAAAAMWAAATTAEAEAAGAAAAAEHAGGTAAIGTSTSASAAPGLVHSPSTGSFPHMPSRLGLMHRSTAGGISPHPNRLASAASAPYGNVSTPYGNVSGSAAELAVVSVPSASAEVAAMEAEAGGGSATLLRLGDMGPPLAGGEAAPPSMPPLMPALTFADSGGVAAVAAAALAAAEAAGEAEAGGDAAGAEGAALLAIGTQPSLVLQVELLSGILAGLASGRIVADGGSDSTASWRQGRRAVSACGSDGDGAEGCHHRPAVAAATERRGTQEAAAAAAQEAAAVAVQFAAPGGAVLLSVAIAEAQARAAAYYIPHLYRDRYLASLSTATAASSGAAPPPAAGAARQGRSQTAVVAAVVCSVGGGALVAAALVLLLLGRRGRWLRRGLDRRLRLRRCSQSWLSVSHDGKVKAPGVGPGTALVVTDIQSSTRLWESLPADVMSEAVHLHHACIRRLVVDHQGYESATEDHTHAVGYSGKAVRRALRLAGVAVSGQVLCDAVTCQEALAAQHAESTAAAAAAAAAAAGAAAAAQVNFLVSADRDGESLLGSGSCVPPGAVAAAAQGEGGKSELAAGGTGGGGGSGGSSDTVMSFAPLYGAADRRKKWRDVVFACSLIRPLRSGSDQPPQAHTMPPAGTPPPHLHGQHPAPAPRLPSSHALFPPAGRQPGPLATDAASPAAAAAVKREEWAATSPPP